jgi:GntR family transcriptional repressor for pyruvate dehydrogenase complex
MDQRPPPPRAKNEGAVFAAFAQPRQVSGHIADQIEARIADGTLAIGQRLPTEAELAQEFGVSRPSVREGLAALQFVGLVESRRGYGTVVIARSADSAGPHGGGGRTRQPRSALTSLSQVLDLFETRLVLEPAAMALAAQDPDPVALEAAEELIDGMDVAVDDPALHASTDIRVHRALLEVCRNDILRASAGELLDLVLDPMLTPARAHAWSSHDRPQGWAEQHRAVYEALRSRDAAAAGAFSRAHLVSVLHGLAEVLSDEPGLVDRVGRIVRLAGDPERPDHSSDDPPSADTLTVLKAPQEASDVDRH